jgi:hypothetical protein
MGFGTSLALGFIQQTNKNMAEKRAAEAEAAKAGKEAEIKRREGVSSLVSTLVQKEMMDPDKAAEITALNEQGLVTMSNVYSAVGAMDDVENNTMFGGVSMKFEATFTDDKSTENLSNINMILSNPDAAEAYLQEFTSDPAGAQQFLAFTDSEFKKRGQWVYLNKSGVDEVTKAIKSPVYATFSEYKPLLSFRAELQKSLGMSGVSAEQATLSNAINTATEGEGLKDNEVFILGSATEEGTASGVIQTVDAKTATSMDKLAEEMGFADRNVWINSIEYREISDSKAGAYIIIQDQSVPLYEAGALQLLSAAGAGPNVTPQVVDILLEVSPGLVSTRQLVNAILPLIKVEEPKASIFGIEGRNPSGPEVLKNKSIKSDDIIDKNTFASNSVSAVDEILANLEPVGKDGVKIKTGFAGIVQSAALKVFGSGGQINQLFGGSRFDESDFVKGTTSESLSAIVADVLDKDLAERLGENEVLMVSLAYSMARAVDGTGRLSNDDFRIQMEQLKGDGVFDNINITKAKLERLRLRFYRLQQDTEVYANIARSPSINAPEQRRLQAYVIAEKARKFHRRTVNVGGDTGRADTRLRFGDMSLTPAENYEAIPGSELFFDDSFNLYERKQGSEFVTKVADDDQRIVFKQQSSDKEQQPQQQEDNATEEQQSSEQPPAEQGGAIIIDATQIAGKKRKPLANGNIIVDGVEYKPLGRGKYQKVN